MIVTYIINRLYLILRTRFKSMAKSKAEVARVMQYQSASSSDACFFSLLLLFVYSGWQSMASERRRRHGSTIRPCRSQRHHWFLHCEILCCCSLKLVIESRCRL
ncbi:hypothetical protein M758_4G200600 [Ceratodon purpureus]|nr:hypothetical protein M758_4G200600 [Ceratodon purpureus]